MFWVATSLGMLSLSTSGIRIFRGCSNHVFVSCGIHVACSCGSSILVFVGCGISINLSLWHTGIYGKYRIACHRVMLCSVATWNMLSSDTVAGGDIHV